MLVGTSKKFAGDRVGDGLGFLDDYRRRPVSFIYVY